MCSEFEEKCLELLGKPLDEVLSENGYDTPTVEALIEDMIENPALTDGLLVRSAAVVSMNAAKAGEHNGLNSEVEDTWEDAKEPGPLHSQQESLKNGSSVTLRSLKKEFGRAEGFNLRSVSSLEDEFLQVRLRMRILLVFYNSGHGVEARDLHELYVKSFGQILNLRDLGFNSVIELARQWQDVFLLQEPKPGWVFLVPSKANRRILNTLRMELRSSVFPVLVETYPEGLEPLDFLLRLQEGMSGELWEVLEATRYVCSNIEKADSILSSSTSSDFQLVDFEEICVLLDDIVNFVSLGSNEDGAVVVKLQNGEVPVVDLQDSKLNETDMRSFDELFVNLMMIAVDVTDTSETDDGLFGHDGFINVGHVQSLVKSFEGTEGLRSAHSQATDSLRLKHELRLILGAPEYCESVFLVLASAYIDFLWKILNLTRRYCGSEVFISSTDQCLVVLSKLCQNVVPVVCTSLEGDLPKIRTSIVLETAIPLVMFIACDAVILGNISLDATGVDPLAALQSSNGIIATYLNALGEVTPGIVGGSADLASSTKAALKGVDYFSHETPWGRNFHYGIGEHAMGGISNGLAFHGSSLIPFAATFLIFSDYMKNSMRLPALSEAGVIYILTHDSIGLGEDGPTHQPVE